ncbi:HNH endonuclease [Motilimonas pumila]|uniref:HNH endonuclease n=1 Tax=Motilimonas pumila TaxID=2303987 RepID=A0A418YIX7_9GAMM|nr:HNH endonuclease [Motilimonas pumila]RJG50590.1 HNH endonuclease [Motilimonas pumila]
MRALVSPQCTYADVLNTCVNSISCATLTQRINAITTQLNNAAQDFDTKAVTADLFQIQPFFGADTDNVVGQVTKKELKGLYTYHLVPAKKPARQYYDQIMMQAPLRICPFCGFGQVTTLDHYLPKAKFPLLSILPKNLVPSCADCNKGKSAGIATSKNEQCLHPYFDQGHFINDQWLFAEVIHSSPATISYFVQAPGHWNASDQARVNSHFDDFKLANRFSIQAGDEISNLRGELDIDFQISQQAGVEQALRKKYAGASLQHTNSWKTAMYQALAASAWYCSGGFK